MCLGEHATQAGSLVRPDRLRFDFTHFEGLTGEQIDKIERLVNRRVFENLPVRAYETSLASARESGVTALFGEKYTEFVRVLEVGTISKELCGGTHVSRTSEIGFVKVVSESSVGANLRRIEALTSFDAYELVRTEELELSDAAEAMKVPPRDVSEKAAALVKRIKELEAGVQRVVDVVSDDSINRLLDGSSDVGYRLVIDRLDPMRPGGLRHGWDILRARGANAAVLVSVDAETDKPIMLAAGDDVAVKAGFNAGAVDQGDGPPRWWPRRRKAGYGPGRRRRCSWHRCCAVQGARVARRVASRAHVRILALDIGEKRVGVAVSDASARVASALTVLEARSVQGDCRELRRLLEDYDDVELIIIGLPMTLEGM